MADLARHAVGVDLVEVALRQALGLEVPDELVKPRFSQPLAIKFLTASPGPLPTGRVVSVGPLDKVLAFPGVVQAELYLQPGETIRPVRLDGDRRGYVIAVAETNLEALERAEAAARLADVVGRMSWLRSRHYASCSRRRRRRGYRFAHFDHEPRAGDLLLRHDVDLSLARSASRMAELEAAHGASATYFLMTRSVFYNLASAEGESALARLRELGHRVGLHAVSPARRLRRPLRSGARVAQPRSRVHDARRRRARERDVAAVVRSGALPLGLEPALAARRPARRRSRRASSSGSSC